MQPRVIDISHHNTVTDFKATVEAGVWGVIHKASQGSGYRDPDYAARRELANAAGMLWGAYHFNDGTDVRAQVNNFISAARPDPETLLVLDFEDNAKSNMSASAMVQFLRLMEQKVGRKIAIYSGNRLKENIGKLNAADRAYVCQHQLWLCQYSTAPKLPPGFDSVFLWQYTDGRVGPGPHGVAGVSGDVDLNSFRGTREELSAAWVAKTSTDFSAQSAHSAQADEDQPDVPLPAPRPDDADDIPIFMQRPTRQPLPIAPPDQDRSLNVQPATAQYDMAVEVVQRKLDAMGYHEVGTIDGKWGGKTAGAIKAFFNDRGVTAVAEMGQSLNDTISLASRDRNPDGSPWSRPIAPERANAKPTDLAPKNEAVRVNLWQKFGAQITAAVAGLGFTGSTISSAFTDVQSKLAPVHEAFAKIPPEIWFAIVGIVAVATWYASTRAASATTKDYNTGRLS